MIGNLGTQGSSQLLARFLIILFVGLLPLGASFALEQNAAPANVDRQAASLAGELDRLMEVRLRETFTIAAFPSIRALAASDATARAQRATVAYNELNAWVAADPPVREVFIVDLHGVSILSTAQDWNQDWSKRAFVASALTGKPDISAISRDVNEFSQYYSAPVLDNRADIAGALIVRVEAQELWGAVNAFSAPQGEGAYAVVVDENGVRLADGGNPSRNLTALAPLGVEQQTRVINQQTFGSQVTILRADRFEHAAELIGSGKLDGLSPSDLAVDLLRAERLKVKPWTVLFIQPAADRFTTLQRLLLPVLLAIAAAAAATILVGPKKA